MGLNRRGRPRYAIGYVRVSTRRQADEGFGLEAQVERLRIYAAEHGYTLRGIYEDIASGNDRRTLMDRPDFKSAVLHARHPSAVIIVMRLDRISRNSEKFREFLRKETVRIVSTVPGETEDFNALGRAVSRGQRVRQNISEGTMHALGNMKRHGRSLGNLSSLPAASRASRKARSYKSFVKVQEIRNLLFEHPDIRQATASEIAKRLNAEGILSGRDLPWTKDSVRRQLRLAREELKLLLEPDDGF